MPDYPYPKAILFDLDDTIITGEVGIEELWRDLCGRHAAFIEGLDGDVLLSEVNKARNWYWDDPERHRNGRLNLMKARRELVALAFSNLGVDNEEVCNSLADTYSAQRQEMIRLIPGTINTLSHFKECGLLMALITNGASEFQRPKIERFKLEQYFDYILVEGEFGAGKPDLSVFVHTLDKLGVTPDQAWMVGDDLKRDIVGANEAGVFSIWVDLQKKGLPDNPPARPDRIVTNISELV
ncbi:MAG: HAD-IA family hydrolase [Dehalococcoidales bacterium]|nr:MAG: HAD-IA family hydrolase [Dehalococcoidales bacterium]